MLAQLLQGCLDLIIAPCCPLCQSPLEPGASGPGACAPCLERLKLPALGLQGHQPLPWWSLGFYEGQLRRLLLRQRKNPSPVVIATLSERLAEPWTASPLRPLVVAIPSWKRQGNPLPDLICRSLGFEHVTPLERARPTLGQHHLGKELRALNQDGAFRCRPGAARPGPLLRRRPLLIVDDILTTGATACAAAMALRSAGYRVEGLLCLARTPEKGRDLRSGRR